MVDPLVNDCGRRRLLEDFLKCSILRNKMTDFVP